MRDRPAVWLYPKICALVVESVSAAGSCLSMRSAVARDHFLFFLNEIFPDIGLGGGGWTCPRRGACRVHRRPCSLFVEAQHGYSASRGLSRGGMWTPLRTSTPLQGRKIRATAFIFRREKVHVTRNDHVVPRRTTNKTLCELRPPSPSGKSIPPPLRTGIWKIQLRKKSQPPPKSTL